MTSDYGTYRLTFDPPSDQITPGVTMTLSGEANLDQMLELFEGFLRASGYALDGDLEIRPETPTADSFIPFDTFGSSVIYGGSGTDTISFAGAGMRGGMADDVVRF